MTGQATKTGWTVRRASVVAAFICLVELGFVLGLGPADQRVPLLAGLIAGAVGGFVGLWFVARALPGGLNEMLKAALVGFMLRAALVGVGLILVLRSPGADPLAFVATFFPLFFAFAGLEALVATAHANAHRTPAA